MTAINNPKTSMEHYNMLDFLRGQASKIMTRISEDDKVGFVLKNGKPMAVLISNERYERLLKAGIDFFISVNSVWLTKTVPVEYLKSEK
jgi:RNA:NAD 2'-phosphotransferase (TPT1/KptA family)